MLSSSASKIATARVGRSNGASSLLRRMAKPRSSSHLSRPFVLSPASILTPNCQTILASQLYSTERIIEQKSGKKYGEVKSLYNATKETENCGVGLVASLKSIPSRKVVDDADEMLVRMSHRGGCGCDPASGDGAGKCG